MPKRDLVRWPTLPGDHRPRIIRQVTKMGRDDKPKAARDYKLETVLERVNAQQNYPCGYYRCKLPIAAGDDHAVVMRDGMGPFVSGRRVPDSRRYHFDCVPPELRPLARFFACP